MSDTTYRFIFSVEGAAGPVQALKDVNAALRQTGEATRGVRQAASPPAGAGQSAAAQTRSARRDQASQMRIERQARALMHMSAMQAIRSEERQRREQVQEARRMQIRGPVFRIQQAQAAITRAVSPQQVQDAQLNLARAQMNLLRQQRRGVAAGGILGQIREAVMSARIGVGGGGVSVMPLVGRVFDILRSASPVLAAWVTGIGVATAATIEAAKNIREMSAAAIQSGGTFAQVSMLARMGIGTGQIAGAAAGLRERLSSDPFAMMAGGRLGITPQLPRILGPQNEAKVLLDALEALRKVTNAEEQLRLARMLGIESMLDLAKVSNYVWEGMRRDAMIAGRVNTPATQQASRDLMGGLSRLGGNVMTLMEAILAPFVKLGGPVVNALAEAFGTLTMLFVSALKPLNAFIDALGSMAEKSDRYLAKQEERGGFAGAYAGFIRGAVKNPIFPTIGGIMGAIEGWKGTKTELERNTDALREANRLAKEGLYGGGPRARNAIPAGLSGDAFQRALVGNAIRYGAFQTGAG